jgi:chromosome segregation and condensation protein ScpB
VIFDLLHRRYAEHLGRLPEPPDALARLAEVVLASAREVSAADLAAIVGCTRKEAAAALDRLVDESRARRRDEEDFALYVRAR